METDKSNFTREKVPELDVLEKLDHACIDMVESSKKGDWNGLINILLSISQLNKR